MYRLLLVAILSCITIGGFARRKVYLDDRARYPIPPVEVYIDERILAIDILEDTGVINVSIKDVSNNVIFSSFFNGEKSSIPVDLFLKKGTYIITIDCQNYRAYGDFYVE